MSSESFSEWSPPAVGDAIVSSRSLAGFWARVGAHLCDSILMLLITLPFNIVGATLSENADGLMSLLALAVSAGTYAYWIGTKGGSPWRVRLGILILDKNDLSYIGFRRALLRIFVSYISGLALLIGYLWMLFDANNQTWHDKAANTVVVRR